MEQLDDLLSVWERYKEKGESISAEELCRDNPELLDEVRKHIRALEEVDSKFGVDQTQFRESSTGGPSKNRGQSGEALLNQEFQITNRYQIEQHHASGGLGDVYVAIDPILNRKVAIKFPRKTRLTPEQLARFEREARITGQLDHPGIVAVHSLKISDDAQPCYVMRFVHGPTLQERTREFHQSNEAIPSNQKFSSSEFRELMQHFVALCNIVGYAHDQGVIHRDIKPSNVILGPFGQTYLMDWGLARADRVDSLDPILDAEFSDSESAAAVDNRLNRDSLNGNASTKPPFSTKTGQVLGTPAFASPEQLLGRSDQVDQRSDVYSLGASLYFVLTGKLPVETSDSAEYFARLNNEKESLLKFSASIPAPLAAICRAATHVSPDLRYSSPLLMAKDLQSFLASESISVLPDSWGTKALRWMGKNRATSMTAGLATLLLLVGSGIGLAILSANNQKLEAAVMAEQKSRGRAEENFSTASEAVQEFLVRTTENEKLKEADFTDLRKQLLDSATPFYERLRTQEPGDETVESNRAEALLRLSTIQRLNGELKLAQSTLSECISAYQRLSQEHPSVGKYQLNLANGLSVLGRLLLDQGNTDLALVEFQKARSINERLFEKFPDDPEYQVGMATALADLFHATKRKGDRTDARKLLQSSYEIWKSLSDRFLDEPEYHLGFSNVNDSMGILLTSIGEIDQATESYERAIQVMSNLASRFPKEHKYRYLLATQQVNLALHFLLQKRNEDAQRVNETALATLRELASDFPTVPSYQQKLGVCLNSQGSIALNKGELETAKQHHLEAVEVRTRLATNYSSNSGYRFDQAVSLFNVGFMMDKLNDAKGSYPYLEQAMKIRKKLAEEFPLDGEFRRYLARSYFLMGKNARQRGDFETAEKCLRNAIVAGNRTIELMPDVPDVRNELGLVYVQLAKVLREKGAMDDADDCFQTYIKIVEKLVEQYPKHVSYRLNLAGSYCDFGNAVKIKSPLDSLPYYDKAASELQSILVELPNDYTAKTFLFNTLHGKADSLHELARYAEAIDYYQRALKFDNGQSTALIEQKIAMSQMMADSDTWDRFLSTGDSPTTPKQQVAFARYCYEKKEFQRATEEYQAMFFANPSDESAHGYDAACCAILASVAQESPDHEPNPMTIEVSTEFRSQALSWLQRQLETILKQSDSNATKSLNHWLVDVDLQSVRDESKLNLLSDDERKAWKSFWSKVRKAIAME